jgi:hypothetical protein
MSTNRPLWAPVPLPKALDLDTLLEGPEDVADGLLKVTGVARTLEPNEIGCEKST